MNSNRLIFLIIIQTICSSLCAQFTSLDTLRGSITPERAWWDLTHYHLDIDVDPADSTIQGHNTITYEVLEPNQVIQIDLQEPLTITKVIQGPHQLKWTNEGPAHFIKLLKQQIKGSVEELQVFYEGKPHVAIRAPWDGGITWSKDSNGLPFVASSCQGLGASIWWPCKDHMYDEPDSMLISVTTPKELMNVSNGRLVGMEDVGTSKRKYHWKVSSPINNYGVNLSIADYVHFGEVYDGKKGSLTLDYFVLRNNLEKAKNQFVQVPMMMEAFEYWFGPYPFYEDGFKLIEVPYLGMEHQSAVTYGNGYENGYLGRDLSSTGWGLEFDFIIIHEAGHEWFANSITYRDIADMWIHESFTAYSESLYLEYHHGKEAGADYVIGTRRNIQNISPVIGVYNVNNRGSGDMYYKGSNMLHTLRQIVADDDLWRNMLRDMNEYFYHQTVASEDIENYMAGYLGLDLKAFFDQYLRSTIIPVIEYLVSDGSIQYRWTNVSPEFNYPVTLLIEGESYPLKPTITWKRLALPGGQPSEIKVDRNYYVGLLNTTGN